MSPILADEGQLAAWNATLAGLTPAQRVEWALANLPGEIALTSSFGAQAVISLHLATQVRPEVPVILIDTGYLFPETYQFIEQLTERLKLNLKVYAARRSAAWQEAINGRRWEQGVEVLDRAAGSRPAERGPLLPETVPGAFVFIAKGVQY